MPRDSGFNLQRKCTLSCTLKHYIGIYLFIFSNLVGDHGGRGGIRTHETLSRLLVFKTSAFNHSATRPRILAVPGLRLSNCLCGARPH